MARTLNSERHNTMAKVTIIIEDNEDQTGISVQVTSNPPFPGPAAEDQTATSAQHLGAYCMEAIAKATGGRRDPDAPEDEDEDAPEDEDEDAPEDDE